MNMPPFDEERWTNKGYVIFTLWKVGVFLFGMKISSAATVNQ